MRDTFTTTVDAAAAVAREDADDDRPTLGELAGDEDLLAWADGWADDRCSRCGLRPTWEVDSDPCADCRYDEAAGW